MRHNNGYRGNRISRRHNISTKINEYEFTQEFKRIAAVEYYNNRKLSIEL